MANYASFDLKVVGSKADRNRFFKKLKENVAVLRIEESEGDSDILSGSCKHSIRSSLNDYGFFEKNTSNLLVEAYSSEPGNGFEEHYLIENGMRLIDECLDMAEYCMADYASYADFKADYPDGPDESDFDEDGYCTVGGFGDKYAEFII